MKIQLAYGQNGLDIELPDDRTTAIEPTHVEGLRDERAAFIQALASPTGGEALRKTVRPSDKICIVHSDITRPTPNERIIPWLLEELERAGARRENITLLNGVGTHRPQTREELEAMLTPAVVAQYRALNHEPNNPDALVKVGVTRRGADVMLNRHLVEADLGIITGFIEPHVFAGFSGGPKGIMPGVAGMETVIRNHDPVMVGDPKSDWGVTFGNPLWEEILECAQMANPRLFLVNVTLNHFGQITRVFAGDLVAAHQEGCKFVKETAMQPVEHAFEVVITTNSGYPLDQNLYQCGKGISAAARIVKRGGAIILAAECGDAQSRTGPYYDLLEKRPNSGELLTLIHSPGFRHPEQWGVQIQATIQQRAEIFLYSSLAPDFVRSAHFIPCSDITSTVTALLDRAKNGETPRVAVIPQGPQTIPMMRH